jgi:flagellar hook-length control protein FliK
VNGTATDTTLLANAAATPQAAGPAPAANAPSPPETPPAASPALPPPPVFEQVAFSIRQAAKSGIDHIQIQLQPADLGAIQVKLNVSHEGRVEMVVSADRSDTLNLLQQDSGNLAQALRDAGLQADSSSLSFNLRGGHQSQQQMAGGASGSSGAAADDSFEESGGAMPAGPILRAHAGSIDIHV